MSIQVRAAVTHGANRPMTIETLEYEDIRGDQVLVKVEASGLCHSDLHILDGSATHCVFPAVLGHEIGGIVLECGPDVKDLRPGDHVVALFCPECRECPNCKSGKTNICRHFGGAGQVPAKLTWNGQPVTRPGNTGGFADKTILNENALFKVPDDVPLNRAFYTGCGVTTGVGAVMFTAKAEPGAKIIVFGLGGIGLNTLQGARLADAAMVIGVDVNPERETMARRLGATHFVNPRSIDGDLVEHLIALTGGGADHCFECVGNIKLMEQALAASHPLWGTTTLVGVTPYGQKLPAEPTAFLMGRKLQGTMFGGARGRTDTPKVVEWYREGRINIDDLVTHELPLERIDEGFEMMKRGEAIRTVLNLSEPA